MYTVQLTNNSVQYYSASTHCSHICTLYSQMRFSPYMHGRQCIYVPLYKMQLGSRCDGLGSVWVLNSPVHICSTHARAHTHTQARLTARELHAHTLAHTHTRSRTASVCTSARAIFSDTQLDLLRTKRSPLSGAVRDKPELCVRRIHKTHASSERSGTVPPERRVRAPPPPCVVVPRVPCACVCVFVYRDTGTQIDSSIRGGPHLGAGTSL